ncbi:hypothetical protein HMPREF9517_00870 [Enterococcus faecalis TX1341]|nr:hypothetical protein HMPREF9509_00182 [Enterococcus faecalis TX0411]EFT98385.1 hypothetical protein HMPREF9502_00140 [Enterococcus faecalis TX0031]EFU12540.1 hypothetical protein HMPREF9517_00870 [Enterococcus faecalis TX1341]EPH84310.1 hypothetical protein D927_00725 [Enterococcus faecalis 02-MB-BW-10]EPH86328.1 hypothetical protein D924_00629 [Enterococcus faecalis 06-MB-S-10]
MKFSFLFIGSLLYFFVFEQPFLSGVREGSCSLLWLMLGRGTLSSFRF